MRVNELDKDLMKLCQFGGYAGADIWHAEDLGDGWWWCCFGESSQVEIGYGNCSITVSKYAIGGRRKWIFEYTSGETIGDDYDLDELTDKQFLKYAHLIKAAKEWGLLGE